jgi:hypothetical protein
LGHGALFDVLPRPGTEGLNIGHKGVVSHALSALSGGESAVVRCSMSGFHTELKRIRV